MGHAEPSTRPAAPAVRIVITEFMDEAAVVALAERFDVCYDKDLVDRPDDCRCSSPTPTR